MRIAILGLGHMGMPMARNLLGLGYKRQGHDVTIHDCTSPEARTLFALGAVEAHSVADAVKDAEVAITMLSDDAALTSLVREPSGLLHSLRPKSIHLCLGTIEIETSRALAAAHAEAGQGYVAAPVFGRPDAAENHPLWIAVGGPLPQVNRCRPVLDSLGRNYTRIGPEAAHAHALKLGGNILSMAMELAVSELLTIAGKAGLSPAKYLRLLNKAILRSCVVDGYGRTPVRPSFNPEDQTLELAANELLLQKAMDMGVAISVADLINAQFQAMMARSSRSQDPAGFAQEYALATETERDIVVGQDAPPTHPVEGSVVHAAVAEQKDVATHREVPPQPPAVVAPIQVPLVEDSHILSGPASSTEADGKARSKRTGPSTRFTAMDGEAQVTLDLEQISHFKLIKGRVWAWAQGKAYETHWRNFGEVELAFSHVLFLLIQRNVLLRPEAVLDLQSTFGGGAKARVTGNLELEIGRAAASRLRELLGL